METYRWTCPDTGPAKPTELAQWAATTLSQEPAVYCHPRDLDAMRAAIGPRAVLPDGSGTPQPGTVWTALRLAVAGLVLIIGLAALPASAGSNPPRRITVYAPVHSVWCNLGVCCGAVDAMYAGHYYDAGPRGYCRWFRPLAEGQVVRATLTLGW